METVDSHGVAVPGDKEAPARARLRAGVVEWSGVEWVWVWGVEAEEKKCEERERRRQGEKLSEREGRATGENQSAGSFKEKMERISRARSLGE
nr:hypothetical protein CFP56_31797 [Quercus suber]